MLFDIAYEFCLRYIYRLVMSYLWWTWLLCLINVMVEGLPTFEMTWLEYTIRTDMIIKLKSRPGILLIDWCFNWHIHGTVYSPKQYTYSVIPVIDWLVILFNRLPASYGVVSKCWILLIVPSLLEFVDDPRSLLLKAWMILVVVTCLLAFTDDQRLLLWRQTWY